MLIGNGGRMSMDLIITAFVALIGVFVLTIRAFTAVYKNRLKDSN